MEVMRRKNSVAIIIVCFNGREFLKDCLSSLNSAAYSYGDFKIIVVDNASTDGSLEYVRKNFSNIVLIENSYNAGFVGGNNVGIRHALNEGFEYVYLLNQDTVVRPDFLERAIDTLKKDPQNGCVQSMLMLWPDKDKVNSWGNEIHYLGFAYSGGYGEEARCVDEREIAYASGAACLFSADALKSVGVFNEEFFMYHEDVDLGWRMWLFGFRVLVAPNSVVYHKYEFSRSMKKYYWMERNRMMVVFQNYSLATIAIIFPIFLINEVAMLAYSLLSGTWRQAFRARLYFLSFRRILGVIRTRRRVQKGRKRDDREIVRLFTGIIAFQGGENYAGSFVTKYIFNPIVSAYWHVAKKIIFW